MKKSLLFCGVAALAFASCTQNEVLDVNENRAIGFDAFVGKPTKALETNTLSKFYVFGAYSDDGTISGDPNVFNNVEVSGSPWMTQNQTAYWINDKKYKFAAYSNENSKIEEATFTNGTLTIPYTVGTNDLVASNIVSQNGSTTTAVDITLNHILAKVKFTFTNKLASGYKIAISELEIASVPNEGTYTDNGLSTGGDASTPAGSWETSEQGTSANLTFTDIAAFAAEKTGTSEELYVLPQDLSADSGLTVTFKATITDANGTVVKEPSFTSTIKPNWEMKYIYNYTLELTLNNTDLDNNVITFSPTVGGWINDDGSFEGDAPTIVP